MQSFVTLYFTLQVFSITDFTKSYYITTSFILLYGYLKKKLLFLTIELEKFLKFNLDCNYFE